MPGYAKGKKRRKTESAEETMEIKDRNDVLKYVKKETGRRWDKI